MSVRQASTDAVAARFSQLTGELGSMQQAVLRRANAKGMSGGVVVELVNEYKTRMTQLADYCIEQFEWETKHSVVPRRNRGEEWRETTVGMLREFAAQCLDSYTKATRNIGIFHTPGMPEEFKRRLDRAEEEVRINATTLLQKKAAEVNSSTVKGGLGLLKKGALAGGSAVAGYLWHKYFGQ